MRLPINRDQILSIAARYATKKFIDREDAALKLCDLLEDRQVEFDAVVYVPNGGAAIAGPVSNRFSIELVIACPVVKIPSPFDARFGIGALSPEGVALLNQEAMDVLGVSPARAVKLVQLARSKQLEIIHALQLDVTDLSRVNGRRVLILDDAIASGCTMVAAAQYLSNFDPLTLLCCAPLASEAGTLQVESAGFQTLCSFVETSPIFLADEYYDDFHDITIEEINRDLAKPRHVDGSGE